VVCFSLLLETLHSWLCLATQGACSRPPMSKRAKLWLCLVLQSKIVYILQSHHQSIVILILSLQRFLHFLLLGVSLKYRHSPTLLFAPHLLASLLSLLSMISLSCGCTLLFCLMLLEGICLKSINTCCFSLSYILCP